MSPPPRIRLGDLLIRERIVSEAQLQQALEEQKRSGRKLGRVLVENGYVTEDELLALLSHQLGIPAVNPAQYDIDPQAARRLPETLSRRYRALVLRDDGEECLVAMADPTDIFAYDHLVRALERPVRLAVAKEADLLQQIDRLYQQQSELHSLASEVGESVADHLFDLAGMEQSAAGEEAPVARLIRIIFESALKANASDIHIEPDAEVLRIRRRIDGVLYEQLMDERRVAPALVSRLKLMAGADISEHRLPQDGRFTLKVRGRELDVRLATMPTQHGESVVLRLLDRDASRFRLDGIGMSEELAGRFRQAIHRPHGLVLVTGPTGSGKTTTLYAALNELNRPQTKIVTVEDPVEYRLPRVNQVQVNPRIGLDFATVLRTTLRLDPDIILVGEIRDAETARIALRAALTGHLVLASLHTNDAPSTLARLVDMGMEPYLVAASVRAVLAQRLVRRLCPHCRRETRPEPAQRRWLARHDGPLPDRFFAPAGCNQCNHTGYQGRIAVHELLELDETLRATLQRQDQADFSRQAQHSPGYRPLLARALDLAATGTTSLDEILRLGGGLD